MSLLKVDEDNETIYLLQRSSISSKATLRIAPESVEHGNCTSLTCHTLACNHVIVIFCQR